MEKLTGTRRTNRPISEKMVEAYLNLADKLPGMGYEEKVQVIIKMRGGSYVKFMSENDNEVRTYFLDELPEFTFVDLCGLRTPIVIDNTIPDDIEFVMQLKEDYVRIAFQELNNKLNKMFGEE